MDKMYGVTFGDVHSYDDWGVYLSGNTREMPEPRRVTVDVPFRNGLLDVTSSISNILFYQTRKITYDFLVYDNKLPWPELYSKIAGDIHGKPKKVVTDMDPEYYWDAYNCILNTPSANEDMGNFSIECECYPYKMRVNETFWERTISGANVIVNCKLESSMPTVPTFESSQQVKLVCTDIYGKTKNVTIPKNTPTSYSDIVLQKGDNVLTFSKVSSNADLVITYREGEL